jgi:hypothetical protein
MVNSRDEWTSVIFGQKDFGFGQFYEDLAQKIVRILVEMTNF